MLVQITSCFRCIWAAIAREWFGVDAQHMISNVSFVTKQLWTFFTFYQFEMYNSDVLVKIIFSHCLKFALVTGKFFYFTMKALYMTTQTVLLRCCIIT